MRRISPVALSPTHSSPEILRGRIRFGYSEEMRAQFPTHILSGQLICNRWISKQAGNASCAWKGLDPSRISRAAILPILLNRESSAQSSRGGEAAVAQTVLQKIWRQL